jgi:hypothetical protein
MAQTLAPPARAGVTQKNKFETLCSLRASGVCGEIFLRPLVRCHAHEQLLSFTDKLHGLLYFEIGNPALLQALKPPAKLRTLV